MDAAYLAKNVQDPLTEALAAMAIKMPEDKIEFIGKYLLRYVERRKNESIKQAAIDIAEKKAVDAAETEFVKSKELADISEDKRVHLSKLPKFLEVLKLMNSTKLEVMYEVTNFLASFFEIPAVYIAIKRTVGETENLHYLSSNAGQEHVIGKKLQRPIDDGEEPLPRSGLSFNAFKIKEVEPTGEEEDENAPPKPPPTPEPLLIDNVMREKKIKFFGIPKLGSYLAVPFSYQTVDHDGGAFGVEEGKEEEGQKFIVRPQPQELIIAADTIGAFRRFNPQEIIDIQQVGTLMLTIFERIESRLLSDQLAYLQSISPMTSDPSVISELIGKITALETDELAIVSKQLEEQLQQLQQSAAAALEEDPSLAETNPPVTELPESLKPFKEASAVLDLWSKHLSSGSTGELIGSMNRHVLPAPLACGNLLFAIFCLVNQNPTEGKDPCGDVTWESTSKHAPNLPSLLKNFSPVERRAPLSSQNTIASIRTFLETVGIPPGEESVFPAHLPQFRLLTQWLAKALVAREAAINYFKETKNINLETAE